MIYNESFKGALFRLLDDTQFLDSIFHVKAHKLKERLMAIPLVFGTGINDQIFWLLNEVMEGLINGGIVQHSLKFHKDFLFPIHPEEEIGPSVLSLNDLSFGFYIWLGSCGIAVLAFLSELFVVFCKKFLKYLKKLLGLYLMLKILKRVLGVFH